MRFGVTSVACAIALVAVGLALLRHAHEGGAILLSIFASTGVAVLQLRRLRPVPLAAGLTGAITLGLLGPAMEFLPRVPGYVTLVEPRGVAAVFEFPLFSVLGLGIGLLTGVIVGGYMVAFRRPFESPIRCLMCASRATFGVGVLVCFFSCAPSLDQDLVFVVFGSTDTEYADGYSHLRWRQVRPQMTTEQVRSLIGDPLEKCTHGEEEIWSYSRTPTHGDYFLRNVTIRGGTVAEIEGGFYAD